MRPIQFSHLGILERAKYLELCLLFVGSQSEFEEWGKVGEKKWEIEKQEQFISAIVTS